MHKFTGGFFTGSIFSGDNKIDKIKEVKVNSVYFVIKITDKIKFDKIFPDYPGKSKVQPGWIYHDKKQIIKIDLGEDIVTFLNKKIENCEIVNYSLNDFFKIKNNDGKYIIDIDIKTFKSFGHLDIYIYYTIDGKEFINYCNKYIPICNLFKSNYNCNIINCKLKYLNYFDESVLFTNYFKLFINNKFITPENILNINDTFNINLNNISFKIFYTHGVKYFLPKNVIYL